MEPCLSLCFPTYNSISLVLLEEASWSLGKKSPPPPTPVLQHPTKKLDPVMLPILTNTPQVQDDLVL